MPGPIEITVISGKGGTGKTVLTSCLAAVMDDKVVADCDVDAPDLHLLLEPSVGREEVFLGMARARIDAEACTGCGRCLQVCRFDAVREAEAKDNGTCQIDKLACEGCGVCSWVCPAKAIEMMTEPGGKWFVSETRYGALVHASLGAAEESSGKLVTIVREEARKLAAKRGHKYVLIDGPPGIGCPVIASVAGVDLAVVVTEPTLSGMHDLRRVLGLTEHFNTRVGVVVNKYDLNEEIYLEMEELLKLRRIPLMGRISFDTAVNRAIAAGKTVLEYTDGKVGREFRLVADEIMIRIEEVGRQKGRAEEGKASTNRS
jgi:MinD superfamily P-loop ATPase